MAFKYFNVKNGVTTGNISLHASNGNIQANTFSGNLNVTSSANLGNVGNVRITGGTANYVLSTDGAGNLSWVAQPSGGTPGGSNTQVQFNDANSFGGNAGFTFNKTTTTLTANNFVASSTANLGAVGNVIITGGSSGQVLATNGSGGLSWANTGTTSTVDNFIGSGSQTAYNLSTTPANVNMTLVSLAGTFQPRTAYSLSGNVLTFTSAPPAAAEIEVTVLASGGVGGGGGSGYTWANSSANVTATANTKYILNTSSSAITVTLPAPSFGMEVGIVDGTGNANVNSITVFGNGANIQGSNANMTVNTSRAAFTLVYYNSAQGWLLTNV